MAFISGKKVLLNPIEQHHLPRLAEWRNGSELRRRTRCPWPLSLADQKRWFKGLRDRKDVMLGVFDTIETTAVPDGRRLIGVVGFCHIDQRDRNAEISFYIGDPEYHRKGCCSEALKLLIRYGFNELNLHRIFAEVFAFNDPSILLLEKLGFQQEGVLRDAAWRNGQWHHSVILGLLSTDKATMTWSIDTARSAVHGTHPPSGAQGVMSRSGNSCKGCGASFETTIGADFCPTCRSQRTHEQLC